MNNAELNRNPLHRYRNTFRAQDGEIDKNTEDGLRAWAIRNVMAAKMGTTADDELADLETWEWDTRMRIRTVDALERIADAADAYRLNHVESLTCGEMFEGVTFSTEAQHEDVGGGETLHSFVRLGLDGVGFDVRSINDEPAYCCGDATAEWRFTSPDELHELASAFRTRYAAAIDMVATTWAQLIADGTIPAPEA